MMYDRILTNFLKGKTYFKLNILLKYKNLSPLIWLRLYIIINQLIYINRLHIVFEMATKR
jgi:hypothetical protein